MKSKKHIIMHLIFLTILSGCLGQDKKRGVNNNNNDGPKPVFEGREMRGGPELFEDFEIRWAQSFCDHLRTTGEFFRQHPAAIFRYKINEITFTGKPLASDQVSFTMANDFTMLMLQNENNIPAYEGSYFKVLENGVTGKLGWICKDLFPELTGPNPTLPSQISKWITNVSDGSISVLRPYMNDQGDLAFEWKLYSAPDRNSRPLLKNNVNVVIKNGPNNIGRPVKEEWIEFNDQGYKHSLIQELIKIDNLE